jgi:hypothetical protein
MRVLQGSLPCITDSFVYEEHGEQKLIILMCLLLYILRARKVKINQIRNIYLSHFEVGVVTTVISVLP